MNQILLDATALPKKPVGAGVYITRLAKELLNSKSEFKFKVLAHEDDFPLFQLDASFKRNFIFLKDYGRGYRLLSEQISYPSIIHREKIDLYHGLHYSFPIIHACPIVSTIHDMTYFIHPEKHLWLKRYYFKFFIRYACSNSERILSVSQSTKNDLLKYTKCDPGKISVTPLGVDNEFKEIEDQKALLKVKDKYHLPDNFILFVGLIEPRKNVGLLIEAFSKLIRKDLKLETKLVIAGRWGWESNAIMELVTKLSISGKVIFPGYIAQEDLPALYTLAKIFVYPSFYEGFGLPVLEAMACGTPVVTTNTSSMPEFVGDSGILVKPGDLEALVNAMGTILLNPAIHADLSRKGRIASSSFRWKKTAELTIKAYKKVFEEKG